MNTIKLVSLSKVKLILISIFFCYGIQQTKAQSKITISNVKFTCTESCERKFIRCLNLAEMDRLGLYMNIEGSPEETVSFWSTSGEWTVNSGSTKSPPLSTSVVFADYWNLLHFKGYTREYDPGHEQSDNNYANTQIRVSDIPNGTTKAMSFSVKGEDSEFDITFNLTRNDIPNAIPTFNSTKKMQMMDTYAPSFTFHPDEKYFPSTVDFFTSNMDRKLIGDNYWLTTKYNLSTNYGIEGAVMLGSKYYLAGFMKGNLANAKVYAYWVDNPGYVSEIVYFIFYPFNKGKFGLGNHVGDWENVKVKFRPTQVGGAWKIEPYEVYLSAHSGGNTKAWNQVSKKAGTHPIVYSAQGSHANYFTSGDHTYKEIGFIVTADVLTDKCGNGTVYDSWGKLVKFDFGSHTFLSNGSSWPYWMSGNYGKDGEGIYRWGNQEQGCDGATKGISGECVFADGPTGPISKDSWDASYRYILEQGEALTFNSCLFSPSRNYYFIMQDDGNGCVYKLSGGAHAFKWDTGGRSTAAKIILQADGNLVMYDKDNKPTWSSDTFAYESNKYTQTKWKSTKLKLKDTGELVLISATGNEVWSSTRGKL